MRSLSTHRSRGQSIVMMAIIFPFLLALLMSGLELMGRWSDRASLEDSLKQSTRSAVQLLDYATLARGETAINGVSVRNSAAQFFIVNLTNARGLASDESPETVAGRVTWTIIPNQNGGICRFSDGTTQTFIQPAVCAEVRPRMKGLLGWGEWQPLITAADTLDSIK